MLKKMTSLQWVAVLMGAVCLAAALIPSATKAPEALFKVTIKGEQLTCSLVVQRSEVQVQLAGKTWHCLQAAEAVE